MTKKFLTICEGGNVRSVSLAYVLRYGFDQDSVALSHAKTPQKTLDMMCGWADYIVCMQPKFANRIKDKYIKKLRVVDVGDDRWMNPLHQDLTSFLMGIVTDWKNRGFKI